MNPTGGSPEIQFTFSLNGPFDPSEHVSARGEIQLIERLTIDRGPEEVLGTVMYVRITDIEDRELSEFIGQTIPFSTFASRDVWGLVPGWLSPVNQAILARYIDSQLGLAQ